MDNWRQAKLLMVARGLFLIYIAALPLVQPFSTRYKGYLLVYSDFVFVAAAGVWLTSIAAGRTKPKTSRVFVWIALFLAAMTAAAVFSQNAERSFLKLGGVFYLAAIAFVTFNLAVRDDFIKWIIMAWVLGTGLTVLGGFLGVAGYYAGFDSPATNKFLFHYGSLPVGNYPRIDSFFDNANMMANYLNVSVALILAASTAGWISKRKTYAFAALLIGVSFFTFSAGIGGILLTLGIYFALGQFRNQPRLRAFVLLAGILVAITAFAATLLSPVSRENEHTVSIPLIKVRLEPSVRAVVWKNALERGAEFPILGRGTGMDAADVRYLTVSGETQILRDAHQAWLNIFGQAGLAGLITFSLLCWFLLRLCRFGPGSGASIEWVHFALSVSFLGAFLFQNLFGSFEDARHLWVLIGLLPASYELSRRTLESAD